MNAQLVEILLVEDDPGDVMLVRESFADHKVGNALAVVSDGVEALDFLRARGKYADRRRPDLIVLDLNLPRKNGNEVLAEIKSDPDLATIPVVVLTTSEAEEDIVRSNRLHAHAYITKPVDFEWFREVVHQIDEFFVGVVKLPTHAGSRTRTGSNRRDAPWPRGTAHPSPPAPPSNAAIAGRAKQ